MESTRMTLSILMVLISVLVFMAPQTMIHARSHHHHHTRHHVTTVSNSNSGLANARNREEAGALPFTETRYSQPAGEEILNTRSVLPSAPRFAEAGKPESFAAAQRSASLQQQQQRQQQASAVAAAAANFNPSNIQAFNNQPQAQVSVSVSI